MAIKINKVYTRSGDDGSTGLVGGTRVLKNNPRVCAYGEIDELNSVLGWVKEELDAQTESLRPVIETIQQELFDLGSELATAAGHKYEGMWKTTAEHVTALEKLCDKFGDGLPELTSFILPGGSKLAAALHIARVTARRAERQLLDLRDAEKDGVSAEQLQYVNRISDLMFILARWSLHVQGKSAPLWVQEKNRKS